MVQTLKIALWNANGLNQHSHELKSFINHNEIDVMLVTETHFTNKSYLTLFNYKIYFTNHPDGTAHGGTAILIRNSIKHHELESYIENHLQATTIAIEGVTGITKISAVYCPPKHNNKKDKYEAFFKTLGNKFIAGGDYNAKNIVWGARVTTTKGRELLTAMHSNNLNYVTTGEPTYWPTDPNKTPDLLDFYITKGIDNKLVTATSSLDMSSDHTPVILNMYSDTTHTPHPPALCNKNTNWDTFQEVLDEAIELKIPLRTPADVEWAISNLIINIQKASWAATPTYKQPTTKESCPQTLKEKILEKRRLRRNWQQNRTVSNKNKFNKAARKLKKVILEIKNDSIQRYLEELTPTEATDYSLWKATRKLKSPQTPIPPIRKNNGKWARNNMEKADAFGDYLSQVFQPNNLESTPEEMEEINKILNEPFQMELPIPKFKFNEVKNVIMKEINPKKAPGYDLITGRILQKLTKKGIMAILHIFNAIVKLNYFPQQLKMAVIIMLPKPGKKLDELTSYRPISLLPVLSKVLEKLIMKRIKPILDSKNLIPAHQFGFRQEHGAIEQVHRLVKHISNDLENKRYCSAAFLDISQAFDKVWHRGLLYKLKNLLPHPYYELLKSYLSDRFFSVKYNSEYSELHHSKAGVPQGSVLGPMLYQLFTADLPTSRNTITATFADDTAVLASHHDPAAASRNLQASLNNIQAWLKKWKIRINESKSIHVTFTLRRGICPAVLINNQMITQKNEVKYLGLHLDRRLTWRTHIFTKRKQMGLKLRQLYWLIGKKSQLNLTNKILIYKAILKPIWTYGIQLWGSASNSNLEIVQRFQNKVLRIITSAPWYVSNNIIEKDLQVQSIKTEVTKYSEKYKDKTSAHSNDLVRELFNVNSEVRRLKRFKPTDLINRFK